MVLFNRKLTQETAAIPRMITTHKKILTSWHGFFFHCGNFQEIKQMQTIQNVGAIKKSINIQVIIICRKDQALLSHFILYSAIYFRRALGICGDVRFDCGEVDCERAISRVFKGESGSFDGDKEGERPCPGDRAAAAAFTGGDEGSSVTTCALSCKVQSSSANSSTLIRSVSVNHPKALHVDARDAAT
jgi:hypothetical protein